MHGIWNLSRVRGTCCRTLRVGRVLLLRIDFCAALWWLVHWWCHVLRVVGWRNEYRPFLKDGSVTYVVVEEGMDALHRLGHGVLDCSIRIARARSELVGVEVRGTVNASVRIAERG